MTLFFNPINRLEHLIQSKIFLFSSVIIISNLLGLMSSLTGRRRRKRSFYLGTPWELPLLDKPTTEKFLSLLETTLEVRKVHSTPCKRQHLCKVYQWSLKSEDRPVTLTTLERALVNIFG